MDSHEVISCPSGHKLRVPTDRGSLTVTCPKCHVCFEFSPARGEAYSRSVDPTGVTPSQFEQLVAAYYMSNGYHTEVTPTTGDYGVDVFATKGEEKLAIQAKMYGGSTRPVNREMVMALHGAKDYFDCTKAVIVTDGRIRPDAAKVARKLKVELREMGVAELLRYSGTAGVQASTFDEIWRLYIMPLTGKVVSNGGLSNEILNVDWTGIERKSSEGKTGCIPIEVFRTAVEHILRHGWITRGEINENYAKRGSSGVVLVLSQVPLFEYVAHPQGIRMRSAHR